MSLEERYKNQKRYVKRVRKAAKQMVKEDLLLPEDAEREIRKVENASDLFVQPSKN